MDRKVAMQIQSMDESEVVFADATGRTRLVRDRLDWKQDGQPLTITTHISSE